MRILVLDNYDSFTYNLVYIVRQLGYGAQMDVFRNDKINLEDVANYDKILLSPGPGVPSEAGIMPELLKNMPPPSRFLGYAWDIKRSGKHLAEASSICLRCFME